LSRTTNGKPRAATDSQFAKFVFSTLVKTNCRAEMSWSPCWLGSFCPQAAILAAFTRKKLPYAAKENGANHEVRAASVLNVERAISP
jgi:hypothetical protein